MKSKNNWHKQLKIQQTNNVIALKKAYIDWFSKVDWNLEITLSRNKDWSPEEATRAFNMLGQRLDIATYGNSRRRYGKSLERWFAIEYAAPYANELTADDIKYASQADRYGRWHLHGFVKVPDDKRLNWFGLGKLIQSSWVDTNQYLYGKKDNKAAADIKPIYDKSVWFDYCTKQLTETGDIFLLNASHINISPV